MLKKIQRIASYSIKKIIISCLLILSCLMVILCVTFMLNAYRINYFNFNHSLNKLLNKTIALSKKADEFSASKALTSLKPNIYNNYYYRFDDYIQTARHTYGNNQYPNVSQNDTDVNFDFNNRTGLILRPTKDNFTIENGILKYEHSKNNILQSIEDLDIPRDSIGEVQIRMKNTKSKKLMLAWSNESDINVLNPYQNDYLAFLTIPDNQFHTYSVNLNNVLKGFSKSDSLIKTISIFPFNVSKENIEIDFVRFISKESKYSRQPYGVSYEAINNEMRKIIYMNSPAVLDYSLDIPPEKRLTLTFGAGVLNADDPVLFKITIQCDGNKKILFSKTISNNAIWQDLEIDMTSFSGKKVNIDFDAQSKKNNIAFWSNPLLSSEPEKKFNVIIVLEDALRADHLSCYDYIPDMTPLKDEWAKNGVIFQNAFSQATHTRASCPSFMTSLYPSATGVWNSGEVLNDKYLTIAEVLRSQGFTTAMFTQNVNCGPNVGLQQGFSKVYNEDISGKRANDIYNGSVFREWIETNKKRNFFLYLHILDPHGPYDPPAEVASRYRRSYIGGSKEVKYNKTLDPPWLKRPTVESRHFLYNEEVKYNDSQFEHLVNLLRDNDLTKNTLIIFIADHGEHMGEHGLWSHGPPGNIQVLHVPMIMVYPEKFSGGVKVTQPVQLLDIMPTILDLAGIEKDDLLIQGESLMPVINNAGSLNERIAFSEEVKFKTKEDINAFGSIFFRKWHIINSENLNDSLSKDIKNYNKNLYNHFFRTRIYNLEEDDAEQLESINFLIDFYFHYKIQKYVNKLRYYNKHIWDVMTKDANLEAKYDPSTVKQLRSLGYVQ